MNPSIALLLLCSVALVIAQGPYPVPLTPGGRNAVHGWLILPMDQPEPTDPSTPVRAWFDHHTPEFWTDSPHNFQIMLEGTMVPFATVNNVTAPIPIPYPPASDMLADEFTFTPPGLFSLNDLLAGRITELYGVVYNGSFDTPYERYAIAIATLRVVKLTTAVYLNISSAIAPIPELRYYSYPRTTDASDSELHVYLSHQIHAAPDFDQAVHALIPAASCTCVGCTDQAEIIRTVLNPGAVWIFPNTNNTVDHRLARGDLIRPKMENGDATVTCKMQILEEIHCVVGPGFGSIC